VARPVNLLMSRIRMWGYLSHMGLVYSCSRKVDTETARPLIQMDGDIITRPMSSIETSKSMMRELVCLY
jgi:hypothetical protein